MSDASSLRYTYFKFCITIESPIQIFQLLALHQFTTDFLAQGLIRFVSASSTNVSLASAFQLFILSVKIQKKSLFSIFEALAKIFLKFFRRQNIQNHRKHTPTHFVRQISTIFIEIGGVKNFLV